MGMAEKTVDVAIICYGEYEGLKKTIESVLKQTYTINTVLLSDDGSGKAFPRDILNLFNGASCQVKIRQGESNLGTVAHMNAAAALLSSTYIKFMSPGDAFYDQNSLKSLVDFASKMQMEVVSSQTIVCDLDNYEQFYRYPGLLRCIALRRSGKELFSLLAIENCISMVGSLFQRSFFCHGGFDENYFLLEDWPAWLRIARSGGRVPCLHKVTTLYPLGGISSSSGNAYRSEKLNPDMRRCYEKEIIPFCEQFSWWVRRVIHYKYVVLCGSRGREIWKQYPVLYLIDALKFRLKQLLINSK